MKALKLSPIAAPSVFDYVDARIFVRDCTEHLKATDPDFSFRKFTKEIGMASPGHIHLMISGRTALTERSAIKLAQGFELNKVETKAFLDLVLLESVSDDQSREELKQKIINDRMNRKKTKLKKHQFAYFSHWYYPAIRELVGLADFKMDLSWIASRLRGQVSTSEVSQALKTLFALGLIRSEGAGVVQSEPSVSTDDVTAHSDLIAEFHKAMMEQAQESQSSVSESLREISGMTITIGSSEIEKLKQDVLEFQRAVFQKYGQAKPHHDQVYHMNLHLFPLTK